MKDRLLKRRDFIMNAVGATAFASTAAFVHTPLSGAGDPPTAADPSPAADPSFDRATLLCMMRGALAHAAKEKTC